MDQMLFVPSDVRLRLGRWGVGDTVLLERLTTKQRWTASHATAATLVAFMGGRTRRQAVKSAADALGVGQDALLRQVDRLAEAGLLVTAPNDPDPIEDRWRRHGWIAAYDHHLATWGFPLVDYTTDGWKVDRGRMENYRRDEPDPGPLRHDYCARLPTSVGLTESMKVDLSSPLTAVFHDPDANNHLDLSNLCVLLAKTFCFTDIQTAGKIRRTSPSGGARHPAEGYVITQGVIDMPDGIWHVDAARHRLVRVPGTVSVNWTKSHLEGLHLAPFTPQAFVLVTAVFDRNMYRYREPRTFRTIFMDVGHLLGTFEMVASALELRTFIHPAINEIEVERMLGLSPLKEGVIAGAAVTGRP